MTNKRKYYIENNKLDTVPTSKGTAPHFYKDGKHYYMSSCYIMTVDDTFKTASIESIDVTSNIQSTTGEYFCPIPGYRESLVLQIMSWNTNKIEITSFFEFHIHTAEISRNILKECLETYNYYPLQ